MLLSQRFYTTSNQTYFKRAGLKSIVFWSMHPHSFTILSPHFSTLYFTPWHSPFTTPFSHHTLLLSTHTLTPSHLYTLSSSHPQTLSPSHLHTLTSSHPSTLSTQTSCPPHPEKIWASTCRNKRTISVCEIRERVRGWERREIGWGSEGNGGR